MQESEGIEHTKEINQISITDPKSQYADLIFYLKNGYNPSNISYKNKRAIRLKAKNFMSVDDVLFRRNYDFILLRRLEKLKRKRSCRNYMMV